MMGTYDAAGWGGERHISPPPSRDGANKEIIRNGFSYCHALARHVHPAPAPELALSLSLPSLSPLPLSLFSFSSFFFPPQKSNSVVEKGPGARGDLTHTKSGADIHHTWKFWISSFPDLSKGITAPGPHSCSSFRKQFKNREKSK